tara:strand:- start:130 stop:1977 length:1848 start_codon:yes stop_codon:yes gene_type:complete
VTKLKLKTRIAAVLATFALTAAPTAAWAAAPLAPSTPAISSSSEPGAASTEAKVLVNWTASASADVVGHTVRLTPDGGAAITGVATCAGSACSATFSSLTGGTSYTATVTATNGANESTSVTSNPFVALSIASSPQQRAVSASGTDIVLTWTAPASNGGSPITSYSITAPGSGFTPATVAGDIRTYTATGLSRGTSYTFQIAAVNGIGSSATGAFPAQVAPDSPDAPAAPTISLVAGGVRVDWVAPASGGAQIQSYAVALYRGDSIVETASAVDGSLATHSFVTSTTGIYKATVAARNSVDLGPASVFSSTVTISGGALLTNVPTFSPSSVSPLVVGQTQALTASAPSGEPVTVVSNNAAICTLISGVLRAVSAGTCTLSATAAANDTYDSGSATLSVSITAAAAAGGGGGAAAVVAPVLTARPVLTGSAVLGEYLVASAGTWQSQANLDFSYRWLSCDIALSAPTASQVEKNCQAIGTERLFRYLVSATDDGKNLLVEVTALNSAKLTTVTFSSSVLFNAVPEAPATPAYWPKKLNDSSVKMYAKNIVGAGKVQFFLNGREIAWVRAADANDPKLRTANGFQYLVRTVTLKAGMKNVLEIYVDGERVRRAAYSY